MSPFYHMVTANDFLNFACAGKVKNHFVRLWCTFGVKVLNVQHSLKVLHVQPQQTGCHDSDSSLGSSPGHPGTCPAVPWG